MGDHWGTLTRVSTKSLNASRKPAIRQGLFGSGDLHQRLLLHIRFNSVEWITQPLPLIEAAAQRAHALDSQFVKFHRSLGRGGLAGARAIQHDIAIAGNLV